jgi:hypothetical protein
LPCARKRSVSLMNVSRPTADSRKSERRRHARDRLKAYTSHDAHPDPAPQSQHYQAKRAAGTTAMRAGCQIPAPSTSASIPTQPPGKAQQGDFHKPQCPLHAGHQALRTGSWPRATQANARPVHPATPGCHRAVLADQAQQGPGAARPRERPPALQPWLMPCTQLSRPLGPLYRSAGIWRVPRQEAPALSVG